MGNCSPQRPCCRLYPVVANKFGGQAFGLPIFSCRTGVYTLPTKFFSARCKTAPYIKPIFTLTRQEPSSPNFSEGTPLACRIRSCGSVAPCGRREVLTIVGDKPRRYQVCLQHQCRTNSALIFFVKQQLAKTGGIGSQALMDFERKALANCWGERGWN